MAKFVCGQAVKIVRCDDYRKHLVGTESFVTEVRTMFGVTLYGLACAPIHWSTLRLGWLCWFDHELEPIIRPDAKEEVEEAALEEIS